MMNSLGLSKKSVSIQGKLPGTSQQTGGAISQLESAALDPNPAI